MKRILVVNQHTVPIFIDVVNAFTSTDCEIVLFTGHVEEGAKPVSNHVRLIRSIGYNRSSSIMRLVTWTLFTFHYGIYLLTTRKPDRILVVTNPPLAPLVSSMISRLRRIPFYLVMYDLYPNAFVQAGLLKQSNLLYKWWQRINIKMFTQAKAIFTLSDSMKKACGQYASDHLDKIKVIYNWADTEYITPVDKSVNGFVLDNGWQGKKIVLYAGNMGLTHDLESLIHAAKQLEYNSEIIFVFIGDGGKRKRLENLKAELQVANVFFLPYQNKESFPLAMAAADIGVVTLGLGAEGISVPSKTYINFACGCALLAIAPESSELSRLIRTHEAGIVCEPEHPEQVAQAINSIFSNPEMLSQFRKNSLAAAQQYTPKNARKYVDEVVPA